MIATSSRRPGLSLLEVLVAIFVMGIGVISLLVLFPLGLQNAKWALDNEQVGRAAATGQVMSEVPHMRVVDNGTTPLPLLSTSMQTLRDDDTFRPQTTNQSSPWWQMEIPTAPVNEVRPRLGRDFFLLFSPDPINQPSFWTFATAIDPATLNTLDPATGLVRGTVVNPPPGNTRLALPPVFVDPTVAGNLFATFGTNLGPFQVPFHVGATNPLSSPRSPFANHALGFVPSANRPPASLGLPRFLLSQYRPGIDYGLVGMRMENETTMGDEVVFDQYGRPTHVNPTAAPALRQFAASRRFSWAYLCRWVDYNSPDVCDVTVALFNARPLQSAAMTGNPPGEESYQSSPNTSLDAGLEFPANNFGRMFIKGSTTAVLALRPGQTANLKAGDWLLDNTFILPEFDQNTPLNVAPFLDQYSPTTQYAFASGTPLRPGLCGGYFYKVVDVGNVRAVGGEYYQVVTLDRPAKSDGFIGTVFVGLTDVIEKGVGRMPLH